MATRSRQWLQSAQMLYFSSCLQAQQKQPVVSVRCRITGLRLSAGLGETQGAPEAATGLSVWVGYHITRGLGFRV